MTDKTGLYHEIGHYMVASGLDYKQLGICLDPLRFIIGDPETNEVLDYKKRILIAFGGLAAEKLLGVPLNAGHIGDLQIACGHLKKLKNLEGKVFEYKNYLDFPDKEYDYYLDQAKIVLNQLGGKQKIIELAEGIN